MKKILSIIGVLLIAVLMVKIKKTDETNLISEVADARKRMEEYYKISYDSKTCGDQKEIENIFLAIGQHVFRVKWDDDFNPRFIERIAPEERDQRLNPPDKNAPEGCFKNPIQLNRFSYKGFHLQRLRDDKSWGAEMHADAWNRISHNGTAKCGRENEFFLYCRQYSPEPKTASAPAVSEMEAVYKADESVYVTPSGRSFIIYCQFGGGNGCDFRYMLLSGLEMSAQFIRHDENSDRYDNNLPSARTIASIIEMDKKNREIVATTMVINYKWNN